QINTRRLSYPTNSRLPVSDRSSNGCYTIKLPSRTSLRWLKPDIMTYLNNFIPGFFLAVRVGDANGDARVPASGSAFTRMDTALTTGSANLKTAFICLFLVGAALRLIDVWRPVDRASWRECDEASIARNYYREDMNVLHPRVDWR